jgi:2-oxoisovalerate dehydrogenase E2 component (dihydrolipoyl transacylase)
MKYFKLPDLGEGLNEAEIVQWYVKEGEAVKVDQLMVSVETAKAIVDIPSVQTGIVAALFAQVGDVIHLGEPLMEYEGDEEDSGTVVGDLSVSHTTNSEDHFIVGSAHDNHFSTSPPSVKATPSVRALAKRLLVDLSHVHASASDGQISSLEVEKAAQLNTQKGVSEALKGVRKTMARVMSNSHAQVVPVTLNDDVDIFKWPSEADATMRLVHAIGVACKQEPALNVWFDGEQLTRRLLDTVDLGIAVDTEKGLFVPVLRGIHSRNLMDLRSGLDALRDAVNSRKIPPQEMQGATITLSNFGTLAGKYANPIVVPPTVAIIGAGGIREEVVAYEHQAVLHPIMPLSLSFDHRAVTGGEAARFLKAMMDDLAKADVE